MSSIAAGTPAQNLIVAAKPRISPAAASRRGLASRPSRNAAVAASSAHKFIHGSSSRVRAAMMSAG